MKILRDVIAYENGTSKRGHMIVRVYNQLAEWSGKNLPQIGDVVMVRMNNIGPVKVTGFFVEEEWNML